MFRHSGYETGSNVSHSLESSEKMVGNTVQQAVSNVQTRRHVGTNDNFCGFPVEKISNSPNTVEMKICHTTNVLHVVVHA